MGRKECALSSLFCVRRKFFYRWICCALPVEIKTLYFFKMYGMISWKI